MRLKGRRPTAMDRSEAEFRKLYQELKHVKAAHDRLLAERDDLAAALRSTVEELARVNSDLAASGKSLAAAHKQLAANPTVKG